MASHPQHVDQPSTIRETCGYSNPHENIPVSAVRIPQLINFVGAEVAESHLIHNAFKLWKLSDESNRLYMNESYNEVKLPLAFIKTSSNLLTDWQNDFHCFMIGSPVASCITKAKKSHKKSKNHPMVDVLTFDEIWQSFNEPYRTHIARNLNKFPIFTA
ncbi:hypothetical protein C1645_832944 [Glomus cerebriforme]|uniref:Uncharacterized protein n=1 Tax=Glomus cerebriforme TaxID=658196 RepID=A0A397SCI9_9GLOM|nr:hypothetical protein C1645_832944 [Glomus cerebriforme]